MGRSVVRAGAARCPQCSLPPRWCICDALAPVHTPLAVHVLIHRHEHHKPSSTGRLIARAVTGSNVHIYQREMGDCAATTFPAEAVAAGRELWILHPDGEPLPAVCHGIDAANAPHVLLLDGTWRQAHEMLRSVKGIGSCIRLPDDAAHEPSRYWLRDQAQASQLSTGEALMGVLEACGDTAAARQLRLHFELHVYATLLSRGKREMAERYLGHSPLLTDRPEAIDRLHAR